MNELVTIYPNCCIYASKETIEGLYDEKINLSLYHGNPLIISNDALTNTISTSSKFTLFEKSLNIIETPGHDIGCISFQYGEHLFTGDSYIPFATLFTKWKRGNKQLGLYNEIKLKRYASLHKLKIHAGHYLIKTV